MKKPNHSIQSIWQYVGFSAAMKICEIFHYTEDLNTNKSIH
jgi:hypothetical protein